MPLPSPSDQEKHKSFVPKQSFDEYRLKHGPEHRVYKGMDDPVTHKVSSRRRAQIYLALIVIVLAVFITYIITKKL